MLHRNSQSVLKMGVTMLLLSLSPYRSWPELVLEELKGQESEERTGNETF